MKALFLAFITVLFTTNGYTLPYGDAASGDKISKQQYIENWKETAINNMRKYRIPASIILAQGILESNCGNSILATAANNHFGIKCHNWTGETFIHDDDAKDECFRKYPSAQASFDDHAEFLKNRPRYAFLFDLDPKDYKAWAYGLKKAGYATNPQYPQLLIRIIEDNQLHRFDSDDYRLESEEEPMLAEQKPVAVNLPKRKRSSSTDEITIFRERKMGISDNNIKYVEARAGDSPKKLAEELDMGLWQILRYNDLDKTDRIQEGQVIYLQPKRKKAQIERHTLKKGENLWQVSQLYGIRLSRLYKLNNLEENARLPEGMVLKLR